MSRLSSRSYPADQFNWSTVVERTMAEVVAPAPSGLLPPTALLDHYCLPLMEAAGDGRDLWLLLLAEARCDPSHEIALAVRAHRERLLRWATTTVERYQECGMVSREHDAEMVAATVLIALETVAATLRLAPTKARAAYLDARDAHVGHFATAGGSR